MNFFSFINSLITELSAAAVGTVIGGLVIWGARWYNELQIEKKYSISGTYKAYYDDKVDGEAVVKRNTVTLRQKAYKISGEDETHDGLRAWSLEGDIDQKTGLIHGTYKAKTHTDRGMGVFFFEQKEGGTLDGIWAGYDNQNKTIEHGKYTLRKQISIDILPARPEDLTQVLLLLSEQLGDGYMEASDFTFSENQFLLIAKYKEEIIGYALSLMLPKNGFDKHLMGNTYKLPADIKIANTQGNHALLKSLAVDKNYQKQRIASRLVQASLNALQESGAAVVASFGWQEKGVVNIGRTFEQLEFKQRHEFKKFWHQNSIDHEYDCPHCGHPCNCSAVLFSKVLSNKHYERQKKLKVA